MFCKGRANCRAPLKTTLCLNNMEKEYSNSKIISSRPYFEILLVKYTHIVLIVVLCGYCLWEVFEGGSFDYPSTSIEFLVPLFLVIWALTYLIFWPFAYKVVLDPKNNLAEFYMFKKKKPLIIPISDIKEILLSMYVVFVLKNKKVYYNGYEDINLTERLLNGDTQLPVNLKSGGKLLIKRSQVKKYSKKVN